MNTVPAERPEASCPEAGRTPSPSPPPSVGLTGHLRKVYYTLKPFLPRTLLIHLRRTFALMRKMKYAHVWPIDPSCGRLPAGWPGWPDGKTFALVLTHDVETAKGQNKVKALAAVEMELGVRSSFNFVPERYAVSPELRQWLTDRGFEVGVHDLNHDGRLFSSAKQFLDRSKHINRYIKEWNVKGFRAGAMHHNLEWIGHLDVEYDLSTFDTDPFEPQPDGMGTIFPFLVPRPHGGPYVEMPYTLAQDFTVFILFGERSIRLWQHKVDWIARHGGMALLNVHPDYIEFSGSKPASGTYAIDKYQQFLSYCLTKYGNDYWNALPSAVARFVLEGPGAGGTGGITRNG